MAVQQIKTYGLSIAAGAQTANVRATITLYDEKGTIGLLSFVEDGAIPASQLSWPPIGYFPVARYADMVDLLRNESPVYLVTNSGKVEVSTKAEPIGDGEPKESSFIKLLPK